MLSLHSVPAKPVPPAQVRGLLPKPPADPPKPVAGPLLALPEERNGLRIFAFYMALGCIFVRFSMISEVLMVSLGFNTYLLYLLFPPAMLGMFATGGIKRTFRSKASWAIILFFIWMVIDVPFSTWPGGSFGRVKSYAQAELFMLFICAGLVLRWAEVRKVMYTLALAGSFNLLTAKLFLKEDNGRMQLAFQGLISNSNDLAAHLLLMAPFFLFVLLDKKGSFIFRVPAIGAILYAFYIVLGSGSRGAILAIAMGIFVYLLWSTMSQRLMVLVLLPALILPVFMLPSSTLQRLNTLVGEEHEEAAESSASRGYLFRQSLLFTIQHPIFGVGPDQFSTYEGYSMVKQGRVGNWHATHCNWTQVSSECGIPALIFYAGALVLAFRLLRQVHKKAVQQQNHEVANVCFCFLLSMVLYLTAITFLSNAYTFRQPAMVGMAVAIFFAAQRQLQLQAGQPQVGLPQMGLPKMPGFPPLGGSPMRA